MKRLPIAMALGTLLVVSASAGALAKTRTQHVEERTCLLLELMGEQTCSDTATDRGVHWPAPAESLLSSGGDSVAPSNGFAGGGNDASTPDPTPVPIPR